MTRVYIDAKTLYAQVQGHSASAKAGEDIVCAAVTALCRTLDEALREDESFRANTVWDKGRILFRAECWPKKWTDVRRCQQVYRTIEAGFRWLAKEYPEYVRFEEG